LPARAELFMLTDGQTLALFSVRQAVKSLYWIKPTLLFVRLRGRLRPQYREVINEDDCGVFLNFERHYGPPQGRTARLALTTNRRLAERWQDADEADFSWRALRHQAQQIFHETLVADGRCFDRGNLEDLDRLVHEMVEKWDNPASTINGVTEYDRGIWGAAEAENLLLSPILGHVWIGSGRTLPEGESVAGPAVLWDNRETRTSAAALKWENIEPDEVPKKGTRSLARSSSFRRISTRAFDLAFSLLVMLFMFPLYPLIMLAIWIDDGRPFFYSQRRETTGGREFPCLKFRTMRKDAEKLRAELAAKNQSDGPQFFLANDPRCTRVGKWLRKTNLDETPQFLNVILGHMSVVGPRPSPRSENQFCPEWREARLSIRPGITGLWQVMRTRREGLHFQEWIRFDVEYVERSGWLLDLKIIFRTLLLLMRG
jgi:lipopolysaccharide/colanic/teichoic acid biosynthesis glycosyltransferase